MLVYQGEDGSLNVEPSMQIKILNNECNNNY
jgi:hypothetical protein